MPEVALAVWATPSVVQCNMPVVPATSCSPWLGTAGSDRSEEEWRGEGKRGVLWICSEKCLYTVGKWESRPIFFCLQASQRISNTGGVKGKENRDCCNFPQCLNAQSLSFRVSSVNKAQTRRFLNSTPWRFNINRTCEGVRVCVCVCVCVCVYYLDVIRAWKSNVMRTCWDGGLQHPLLVRNVLFKQWWEKYSSVLGHHVVTPPFWPCRWQQHALRNWENYLPFPTA